MVARRGVIVSPCIRDGWPSTAAHLSPTLPYKLYIGYEPPESRFIAYSKDLMDEPKRSYGLGDAADLLS